MFILDLLEKLRDKPPHYRKRIVFFVTSILTGIIFVVWLSAFDYRFTERETDAVAVEKQLRPFEEIKTSIGNFYDSVKELSANIFSGASTSSSEELEK